MNKGISYFFGFDIPCETRARMIKDAGFSHVITTADEKFDSQNMAIDKQVKLFDKIGLKLSSLHMSYKTSDLHYWWEEGEEGENLKRRLIQDVEYAHIFGFSCVVVHLVGIYSKVGERRLLEVLEVCDKYNVPLAIENINYQPLFIDVFKNIKHPKLKFCYDSGHNNIFDKGFDYLGLYGDKLVALHLHDNDGLSDQHTLNRWGTIDWNLIGSKLRDKNVVLDYEILLVKKNADLTPEICLQETIQQAKELENIILNG